MVRLDRITTRSGDGGDTGLGDGSRVSKDHPLINAIGAVDEANSLLGLVLCDTRDAGLDRGIVQEIERIQNDLFDLGADLAVPPGGPYEAKMCRITDAHIARLDAVLAAANEGLPPLTSFVLPGGSRASAWLHLARTVVRRAERDLVAAGHALAERNFSAALRYLNRLSDLCFVWSRLANHGGRGEVLWTPGAHR